MNSEPLSKVAPPKSSDLRLSPDTVVWHLGLDQIVSGTGEITNRTFAPIKDAGSSTLIFDERNVLYSKLRPYLNKVICPDSIGVATTELVPLRPDPKRLDRQYLCFYLRSPSFVSWISSKVAGAKMPRAKMDAFWQHEIPLPPLDDQKRIAYVLSKVEGLITQRKQHLQQLDDLLKSVFLTMFGPTNADFQNWPVVAIGDLAAKHQRAMRTGPFGSNLLHSEFKPEGEVAILGIDNAVQNQFAWDQRRFITLEKYKELENYRIYPGDVIVTIMGTIGRSAVIPDDIPLAINTKHLVAITVDRTVCNPHFLSYSIHSSPYIVSQFASKNRGAIMSALNLSLIKKTQLSRPPITLQDDFASIQSRIYAIKDSYMHAIADLECVYGRLSQLAFRGELDLSHMLLFESPPEIAGDEAGHAAPAETAISTFELPKPNDKKQLGNITGRKVVMQQWLDAYEQQCGKGHFSTEAFIRLVQKTLSDLQSADDAADIDYEVSAADYDHVKDLVFKNLKSNRLKQDYDDRNNRVHISLAKD